jgi:hypothetical protein
MALECLGSHRQPPQFADGILPHHVVAFDYGVKYNILCCTPGFDCCASANAGL